MISANAGDPQTCIFISDHSYKHNTCFYFLIFIYVFILFWLLWVFFVVHGLFSYGMRA